MDQVEQKSGMHTAHYQKFAGNKSLAQIAQQCIEAGITLDDSRYRTMGDDHIVVQGGGARVIFNTFNGRFFGHAPNGMRFSSDEPLDGTPWFDALLRFFYVSQTESAS